MAGPAPTNGLHLFEKVGSRPEKKKKGNTPTTIMLLLIILFIKKMLEKGSTQPAHLPSPTLYS